MVLSELVNQLIDIAFVYGDAEVYINTADSAEFYENALLHLLMPPENATDATPVLRLEGFHTGQKPYLEKEDING